MIPNTGAYAKFTFISKLDSLNGIYQISSIESFDAALIRGVEFYKLLYKRAGLTEDQWKTDYVNYKNADLYWLQPLSSDSDLLPVPIATLAAIPDINVGVYYNFSLLVNVGIYPNVDDLQPMAKQISDIVSATTGSTSSVYWSASQSGALYKTIGEYTAIDEERKAKAKAITPLSTQVNDLNKQIDDLKARNNYLEQALIETISKQNG